MKHVFKGFQAPFYTMVPHEVFDVLMYQLSGAELKVTLYICRRTFGFGKVEDGISLTQMLGGVVAADGRRLDWGCGIKSRSTLLLTLRSLITQNIVRSERQQSHRHGNEATVYRLNVMETRKDDPLGPKIVPRGGAKISPGVGPKIVPTLGPKISPSLGPKIDPTIERSSKSINRKHHHPAEDSALPDVALGAGDDDDASSASLNGDGILNGLVDRMLGLGLSPRLARQYAAEHPAERIAQALDCLPHRKAQNPVGYFIAELRAGDFVAPPVVAQGEQEARKVRALQARMETDQAAETAIAARIQDAIQGLSEGDRAALWAEARLQVARQSRRAVEDVAEDSVWVLGAFEHLVEVRYCDAPVDMKRKGG